MDETQIAALKKGAGILYMTLQGVAALHAVEEIEEGLEGCVHCSELAGEVVPTPCFTMRILMNDFELEEEETPAE